VWNKRFPASLLKAIDKMNSAISAFIFCLLLSSPVKSQPTANNLPLPQKENKPADLPDDKLHLNPAKQAEFPTGEEGWKQYLEKNIDHGLPARNHAPAGRYTVLVRCIVNYWGAVSDVVAQTRYGYGMEQEVARVIKNVPRWVPARQGGRAVNSYKNLSVTFTVGNL
jgi:hypothetical protein